MEDPLVWNGRVAEAAPAKRGLKSPDEAPLLLPLARRRVSALRLLQWFPGNDVVSKPHIQLEALHVLARALAGGEFRARAVLERACAAVARGFGFERVGIVRYIPETSTLIPFAGHGLTPAELAALPPALPIAHFGAFQAALATGRV